jgi:16S rRNA (guanine966-N2)-methyltransferase
VPRIVGGAFGGRRLVAPAGQSTRPTAEKVRAALANSLAAAGGLVGARVLDLYAGSGALGLELLSRGASSAAFVERDRLALTALRANVTTLGAVGVTVIASDARAFAAHQAGVGGLGPFDVVVADPPYELAGDDVMAVITALHRSGVLAAHADLIVERRATPGEPDWPPPLSAVRVKRYGDTQLCYGRAP